MYDLPEDPDLTIANFAAETPDSAAERIVSAYRHGRFRGGADRGRAEHWAKFYSAGKVAAEPSPFARAVAGQLEAPATLLEIGCGNGRDAAYFAALGHGVTAIDAAPEAIALCRERHAGSGIRFLAGALPDVEPEIGPGVDAAYSRFVLHAMPENEERAALASVAACLRRQGRLFVECRSINDPMAGQGEVISRTERIHGHYRRFIILDELVAHVEEAGLRVLSAIESRGLAVFGDEDPMVIRLVAERP
jgi:SAM-dependent methyltransferase